jgi:hypothetical protein
MDRPRNTALKTEWSNDCQVEEVEEVEDRWHRQGEQARALSSFLRGVESLVEQVGRETSQQRARQEEDHHLWTKNRHQARVQGEDKRKRSHWQLPPSQSQQDEAHQQPGVQQDICDADSRPKPGYKTRGVNRPGIDKGGGIFRKERQE